ncbi:hypothetical protein VYU27_007611 [Nannochloropsis oceanica]
MAQRLSPHPRTRRPCTPLINFALRLLLLLALSPSFLLLTHAQPDTPGYREGWSLTQFPNPTGNSKNSKTSTTYSCGAFHVEAKESTSFLCDPDALLSKKGAIAVHEMLDTIRGELKVSCPGEGGGGEEGQAPAQQQQKGLQVGVALVHKLKRTKHDVVEEAEGFARALHGMWGVGDLACQNGVLLFLSRVDRTMYISRGKGVENLLTDDRIDQVMSDVKGLLRGGDWDGGVLMAVGKVAEWVDMGPPGFWERWGGTVVMLLVVIAFLSFAMWQERQKYLDRRGFRGGGGEGGGGGREGRGEAGVGEEEWEWGREGGEGERGRGGNIGGGKEEEEGEEGE